MAGQQTTIASLSNSDSGLCRPGTSGTDQNRVESARQSIVPPIHSLSFYNPFEDLSGRNIGYSVVDYRLIYASQYGK